MEQALEQQVTPTVKPKILKKALGARAEIVWKQQNGSNCMRNIQLSLRKHTPICNLSKFEVTQIRSGQLGSAGLI